LIDSWQDSFTGSEERKLIEDIFLITGTPSPFKPGVAGRQARAGRAEATF